MNDSINGRSGGYYSHVNDVSQTQTAQRSDFRPTLTNRFSNWLGKSPNSKVQAFGGVVNDMRNVDLSARSMVAGGRAMMARARISGATGVDALRPTAWGDKEVSGNFAEKRSAQRGQVDLHYGLTKERYKHKREIGQQARKGKLAEGVKKADATFQAHLLGKDYRRLDMSGANIPLQHPHYLTSADGYAIKMSYGRPLPFALNTAAQVSAQYQNGVTGSARQAHSVYQHIKLGVHNAALWAQQQANATRARQTDLSPARRDHFTMAAHEAQAQRTVNHESLKGEFALREAVQEAAIAHENMIGRLRDHRPPSMYVERAASEGVAPPTVSRLAERAQAYSDARLGEPVDSRRIKWMSSIANSWSEASAKRQERKVADYKLRLGPVPYQSQTEKLRQKMGARQQQADNARAKVTMRTSALQGNLYQALLDDTSLDKRYPRVEPEHPASRYAPTSSAEEIQPEMSEIPRDLRGISTTLGDWDIYSPPAPLRKAEES